MYFRPIGSICIAFTLIGLGILLRRQRNRTEDTFSYQAVHSVASGRSSSKPKQGYDWIRTVAKAELHCHLNGTVRKATLRDLLGAISSHSDVVHTIEDAFREFKRVYSAVDSEVSLRRIVKECLQDSVSDNIRYLELRTTPRKLGDVASRRDYVRIVVEEIENFEHVVRERPFVELPQGKIAVRLILTIDRTQSIDIAEQTVDIALRFPGIVVGIDFAGNPTQGSFSDFIDVFSRARGHGLFTTVHTSEIRDVEQETDAILRFGPDRMGHFLFPTEEQFLKAIEGGIAIESCPTSNICAISGKSPLDRIITDHSTLKRLLKDKSGAISINTDDPGVFEANLSDELIAVSTSFDLNHEDIVSLIQAPARHAFVSKQEREILRQTLARE
jgi:adenosine deaminase